MTLDTLWISKILPLKIIFKPPQNAVVFLFRRRISFYYISSKLNLDLETKKDKLSDKLFFFFIFIPINFIFYSL
jgi:hypothetical protein